MYMLSLNYYYSNTCCIQFKIINQDVTKYSID